MSKKLGGILVAVIAVVVIGSLAWTNAYFSDKAGAENDLQMGNIKGEISEPDWPSTPVAPNQLTPKNPRVTNNGKSSAYVRLRVVQSASNIDVKYYQGPKETPTELFDTQKLLAMEAGTRMGHWVYQEDGYFYYDMVVEPGASTETLFDYIKVVSENYDDGFDIYVMTELVQSKGILDSYTDDHVQNAKASFARISEKKTESRQSAVE